MKIGGVYMYLGIRGIVVVVIVVHSSITSSNSSVSDIIISNITKT